MMTTKKEYDEATMHWTDKWYWRIPLKSGAIIIVVNVLWTLYVIASVWLW